MLVALFASFRIYSQILFPSIAHVCCNACIYGGRKHVRFAGCADSACGSIVRWSTSRSIVPAVRIALGGSRRARLDDDLRRGKYAFESLVVPDRAGGKSNQCRPEPVGAGALAQRMSEQRETRNRKILETRKIDRCESSRSGRKMVSDRSKELA